MDSLTQYSTLVAGFSKEVLEPYLALEEARTEVFC